MMLDMMHLNFLLQRYGQLTLHTPCTTKITAPEYLVQNAIQEISFIHGKILLLIEIEIMYLMEELTYLMLQLFLSLIHI